MSTYTVLHFSADPDTDDNGDDVIASWDFETRDEAMATDGNILYLRDSTE